MRICCRMVPATQSVCPAPMRLLTSDPQVEANAIITMNSMPDTLRTMLVMASERSPKMLHIKEEKEPGGEGEDILYHGPERDVQHAFQYVQPELRNTIQPVLAAVDAVAGIEDEEYQ